MKAMIVAFFTNYFETIFWTGTVACIFAFFLALFYILPTLKDFIKKWTEKNFSEKVSLRIKDAVEKLEGVLRHVLEVELKIAREEILKALADGQINKDEVQNILKKIVEESLKLISPEIATLKNYLTGEALFEYVLKMVSNFAIDYAKKLLEEKANPTVSTGEAKPK